ncbi:arginine decarboxylase [Flavobacterium oncorhynchi]|uniref:Arginine decarboxylase n=1 Tax=Flavobacterium oncorhynchi TaxID=728056 RepID=A0A226HKD2_9FLAO|nr:DUF4266 domain-containing protein [Flavobacterium oncorhynchi]OXA94126.1 arginine decarboxylase [Flavobacterium oncorhynchi]
MKFLLLGLIGSLFTCCQSVKPYQKVYINDEDMQMPVSQTHAFESNYQSYREASSAVNAGKTGGGCGCN